MKQDFVIKIYDVQFYRVSNKSLSQYLKEIILNFSENVSTDKYVF